MHTTKLKMIRNREGEFTKRSHVIDHDEPEYSRNDIRGICKFYQNQLAVRNWIVVILLAVSLVLIFTSK